MYRDFYKQTNVASSKIQSRKENFAKNAKKKRSEAFDFWRGTITIEYNEPKPRKYIERIFKENIRRKQKKIQNDKAKPPPFVVGIVRHKIHSPPFLHGSTRLNKSSKKKILTPQQQVKSFAPTNYKFNTPKGLKKNYLIPSTSKSLKYSPFTLRSLLGKSDKNNPSRKKLNFDHVTIRPRLKKLSNNVQDDEDIKEFEINGKPISRDSEKMPIFGRLNLEKVQQSKKDSNNEIHEDGKKYERNEKSKSSLHMPIFGRFNLEKSQQLKPDLNKDNKKEIVISKDLPETDASLFVWNNKYAKKSENNQCKSIEKNRNLKMPTSNSSDISHSLVNSAKSPSKQQILTLLHKKSSKTINISQIFLEKVPISPKSKILNLNSAILNKTTIEKNGSSYNKLKQSHNKVSFAENIKTSVQSEKIVSTANKSNMDDGNCCTNNTNREFSNKSQIANDSQIQKPRNTPENIQNNSTTKKVIVNNCAHLLSDTPSAVQEKNCSLRKAEKIFCVETGANDKDGNRSLKNINAESLNSSQMAVDLLDDSETQEIKSSSGNIQNNSTTQRIIMNNSSHLLSDKPSEVQAKNNSVKKSEKTFCIQTDANIKDENCSINNIDAKSLNSSQTVDNSLDDSQIQETSNPPENIQNKSATEKVIVNNSSCLQSATPSKVNKTDSFLLESKETSTPEANENDKEGNQNINKINTESPNSSQLADDSLNESQIQETISPPNNILNDSATKRDMINNSAYLLSDTSPAVQEKNCSLRKAEKTFCVGTGANDKDGNRSIKNIDAESLNLSQMANDSLDNTKIEETTSSSENIQNDSTTERVINNSAHPLSDTPTAVQEKNCSSRKSEKIYSIETAANDKDKNCSIKNIDEESLNFSQMAVDLSDDPKIQETKSSSENIQDNSTTERISINDSAYLLSETPSAVPKKNCSFRMFEETFCVETAVNDKDKKYSINNIDTKSLNSSQTANDSLDNFEIHKTLSLPENIQNNSTTEKVIVNNSSCLQSTTPSEVNKTNSFLLEFKETSTAEANENDKEGNHSINNINTESLNSSQIADDSLNVLKIQETISPSDNILNDSATEKVIVNNSFCLQSATPSKVNKTDSFLLESKETSTPEANENDKERNHNINNINTEFPNSSQIADDSLNVLQIQETISPSDNILNDSETEKVIVNNSSCLQSTTPLEVIKTDSFLLESKETSTAEDNENDKEGNHNINNINTEFPNSSQIADNSLNVLQIQETISPSDNIVNDSATEKVIVNNSSCLQSTTPLEVIKTDSFLLESKEIFSAEASNNDKDEDDNAETIKINSIILSGVTYNSSYDSKIQGTLSLSKNNENTHITEEISTCISFPSLSNIQQKINTVLPPEEADINDKETINYDLEDTVVVSGNSSHILNEAVNNLKINETSNNSKDAENNNVNDKVIVNDSPCELSFNNSIFQEKMNISSESVNTIPVETNNNTKDKNSNMFNNRSSMTSRIFNISGNNLSSEKVQINNIKSICQDTVGSIAIRTSLVKTLKFDEDNNDILQSEKIIFSGKTNKNWRKDQTDSVSKTPITKVEYSEEILETINIDEPKTDDKSMIKIVNVSPTSSSTFQIKISPPSITKKTLVSKKKLNFSRNHKNTPEIINLCDSPVIKKEPLITKISKNMMLVDDNQIIDLVSDEEEDYNAFLSRVLTTHKNKISSPLTNPQKSKTSSIENIQKSCISPCKSPELRLPPKDDSALDAVAASPIRVLSLRNRAVDVTPSPKKSTPKKLRATPCKTPVGKSHLDKKEIPSIAIEVSSPMNVLSLRNKTVCMTPSPKESKSRKLRATPCKTPVSTKAHLDTKENSPIAVEVASPIRVLSLRNRAVGITPSPKKSTPRRRKKEDMQRI